MYIGPWQEMHLSRVVASLRAADGADEQRKHLTLALQAASSSRRKLRDVSGLPSLSTGGQSTLIFISNTTTTPPSSILDLNDEDISTTTSNSPHSLGHFSSSTSLSSSLSQSGMSIISGRHSIGGREGEGRERRGVGVLDSSASISFVLGGGAKKKSVPSSISSSSSSSSSTNSTNFGIRNNFGTSSSVNTHPPISTALQSKTSISQVERMRRLYVSGGTIGEEEDEEDKPKLTSELDNELQSLTSFSFQKQDLRISKNQKEKDTSSSPSSHIVTSDDVIPGTLISPKKHAQTERERRLLELIAVQAAQQEALSGQLQHQARVQAAVQNRLMTLLQEDDGIQSKETSRITKVQTSPLGSPTRVYLDTTIPRNSPKLKSTMGQTMSSSSSSSSSSTTSPRIIKSTNIGKRLSESPKGLGENEVLAELEADLERLGIDVTRQDHLMVESPPPITNNSSTRLPLVSEHSEGYNTSIMTTSDTDVTTAASAAAAASVSALYMSQQQQQYMQWLQWQNYYQQQNQWYQMQQQQQQQQQQYEASGALQSEMQNLPVMSTQPMSLQVQTKVQQQDSTSNTTWKGHDSEVDRLKSLFKKR